jgi:hypothetical protein
VAATDTPVSGPRDSGAAVGAADSTATTLAAAVSAGVLSGLAGADVTETVEAETGSTFAMVDTGLAGGAGLGAMAGLGAGAFAATDVGGFKKLILVSMTAEGITEPTTRANRQNGCARNPGCECSIARYASPGASRAGFLFTL